ncbi:MAG: hypothetical protein COV74_09355 [Candidatus Omnitrophica bacterium CG11_big_fil_rev_8_21_14_0_20_45_26]|uniref:Uncharacterized protein n=1 Tax=Candidatus Abzuiibacterium crystallinum TaxID=1974748 RepID=A0A2H0LLP5_9BACT|nr:MAG: hypothetical protein COV74_09355 [Candidatus Omnitrophica bacterium CG11_big_fil_rev_8_21_14_0_20_45_26]PIW65359.1 MAG: hypothetical protein COW12_02295 [Candidatus Omnitrophica bacterium CG12_big_fil_rev_8_21_14_0_65_45_16]
MNQSLSNLTPSLKWFVSGMLVVAGASYLSLLASIWHDTGFSTTLISEAYGSMGTIELTEHSLKYLLWFLVIFSSTGALFFLTKAPERLKILLAVLIPILILSDIGSAWLIIYHDVYVKVMWLSGFLLAVFFMTMVVFIQRDLWFSKEAARS